MINLLCIITAGRGGQDELRVRRLTDMLDMNLTLHFIDKSASKIDEMRQVFSLLNSQHWDLVYQEGTGIAGGIPLIVAAILNRQVYLISSGDPIAGFFRTTKGILLGTIFEVYEQLLYKCCSGFIGWTPYLTGVAIRLGAPKAVTVEGGVDTTVFYPYTPDKKRVARQKYGLNPDHLVLGVVGSLIWVPSQHYTYGLELVEILKLLERQDVSILIVGDGSGKDRMEQLVPGRLKDRAVFTGRIPEQEVVEAMNAMDIGFVTLFGEMGNYRLTTKLPEYLACGVPVAMNPTAAFYDYVLDAGWPLPVGHPATPVFHQQCAHWVDHLTPHELAHKATQTHKVVSQRFDYSVIGPKFTAFVEALVENKVATERLANVRRRE